MSYVIQWSHQAEISIAQNFDYLSQKWGEKVVNKFFRDVEAASKTPTLKGDVV
jgi:hypothetical protein